MADFTYQTRRKVTEKWINGMKAEGERLSSAEKKLIPGTYYAVPQKSCEWMQELLEGRTYWKLSELYKGQFPELVNICVPKDQREDFYYELDEMNQYQMTAGWYRRTVRGKSYGPFARQSILLLWAYSRLKFYGASLADVLTGNVDAEIYDHARTESWSYAGILAAQIDKGNEKTIQAVKDILLGEGNTAMISRELIRGIVMSKSEELYKILGDFLLAARLQEGARQAVCETMDAGRPEAFLHLFKVIEDNNLIRYSSVKRAASTWIGIFDSANVDRISDKLLKLMGQCLRDPEFCEEQLKTNDSIAISCALWAKGFYDAQDGIDAVLGLMKEGTKNQKMTASYFNHSLQLGNLKAQAAKEVILTYPDDLELIACYLPGFMGSTYSWMLDLLKDGDSKGYFSVRDGKAKEPALFPPASHGIFKDEEEARNIYQILTNVLDKMPKKGVDLNPCIFPWYRVTMTKSDIAVRLCLIAWMLQDEAYLDEAAKLIPIVGQGSSYGASRAATARLLLYRPKTETRKNILFELLHNPEEYTLSAAFKLAEAMELQGEDFVKIEQNLKYKKGRANTLSLLRRQEPKELCASIGRLLKEKSEECHMGALDLALGMKKENPKEFEALRPVLAALENPTGKEQVLLSELVGGISEAQDILNTPGYGFYDTKKEWVLPPVKVDTERAEKLFANGESKCIRLLESLNRLIDRNQMREYKNNWGEEVLLGTKLERSRWIQGDAKATPMDAYPFRELWDGFYREEIKTPEMLMELFLYQRCRQRRGDYEKNIEIYKEVFGSGQEKRPPFAELVQGLRYGAQAGIVIDILFEEYMPREMKAEAALSTVGRLVEVLDDSNDIFTVEERRWNGSLETVTKRSADLPIFENMVLWLKNVKDEDWGSAFTIRFKLKERYVKRYQEQKDGNWRYSGYRNNFLDLSDLVQCYVRGIWDKDLFYKAVFEFMGINSLFAPISIVEQKGAVTSRNAKINVLQAFFGYNKIKPVDGKFHFDSIGEEMPEMTFAHALYKEVIPTVVQVELKRGEQDTPFSRGILSIQVVYGIDTMIQILTALGQDTLERGRSYYVRETGRRTVLSHLLKVCEPYPEETAEDLKRALKGKDITKKRLVEMAMYAEQWIPLVEEYLKIPGFKSGCYYFMAHTSERMDEFTTSMVAKYTPLSPEELRDGAFDINWFFEAYEKLGEKDFKLLYDAAKYSSTGSAHARARKYADAALGRTDFKTLKEEIEAKRNKDLLMSMGLLPLSEDKKKREAELLERYQFIQKFKKESRQFGAQRRASEGRAVELALRNLSVNAGFTDVTRLTLRMESKLAETFGEFFEGKELDSETRIKLLVDETGKSSILCEKGGKALKSVPSKFKKDETVLAFQEANKKLKEQYSRTKQMMEQAMEDRTSFEVWELLELQKNPVVCPIVEPLVVMDADASRDGDETPDSFLMGFLTASGLMDWSGALMEIAPDKRVLIAHPFDLYKEGHWHEYQKLLFEKQIRQPFKQVFRELYVKLEEELDKETSLMFAGNQIQPQKTVGALRSRRWVADYEDGLQKIYYKENIVARIYAMADWFSPSDVEAPTLEYVVFFDRKTFRPLKIREIPDVIYSEVMRDVDLAVSVAHAGGVDPETSHSTVEMRRVIVECNLELFRIKNVHLEGNHAVIDGKLGRYTVHLGSGVVHQMGNSMLYVVPVHSQHRGRIFLPFIDDDPKTAEIMSKILLFAEDNKIKDPSILSQIR